MKLKPYGKNKRINYLLIPLFLFLLTFMGGCNQKAEDMDRDRREEGLTYIYYIDKNETKLEATAFIPESSNKETMVEEFLDELNTDPKELTYKRTIPGEVIVEKYSFNEDGGLILYFSSSYNSLSGISEVLCRAGIVKTLCQIKAVEYVEFYVGGQPLLYANERLLMQAEDFIDDTSAENVYVTVYFSNEAGDALVDSYLKLTSYDGNISIERLIVETLINGPVEDKMLKAIPEGTVINKILTKDSVCTVDFNAKFLSKMEGIQDQIVIYSVVNSLVELATVNKVQFTIDGAVKKLYREDIAFDGLFERNLDLVEGSK